jgi:hypothetical protein
VAISPEGLFLEAGIVPCPPGEGFVPDPTATIHRVAARV